jgi:hypothetical protein
MYLGVGKSPTPSLLFQKNKFHFMKRSKVFLGVTASLLAVVGFAATKSHFNPVTAAYYTALEGNSPCTLNVLTNGTVSPTSAQIQTFYGAHNPLNVRNLFTANNCIQPLFQRAN